MEPVTNVFKFKNKMIADNFMDEFKVATSASAAKSASRKRITFDKPTSLVSSLFSEPPANVLFSTVEIDKIANIIKEQQKIRQHDHH